MWEGGIGYVQMLQRVVKVRGRYVALARVTWPGPVTREAARGVKGGVVGGETSREGVDGEVEEEGRLSLATCEMGRRAWVQ